MNIDTILEEWEFVRRLSLDLLAGQTEASLIALPGANMGALWKQFRHIGRVEEDYTEAILTGKIEFDSGRKSYSGGPDKESLRTYLLECDRKLLDAASKSGDTSIDWFGDRIGLDLHLVRLVSHETLHHGQWIQFVKSGQALDVVFPKSWEAWGV